MMEKSLNFGKKIKETNKYYLKERRIFWGFIVSVFLIVPMNTVLYIGNHVKLNYCLYFILSVIFSYVLSLLTFIQIEKYMQNVKISPLKKYLEKIIKIESYFKNKKIRQIIAIILTFFILIPVIKIAILAQSFYMSLFLGFMTAALGFQLFFFVYDLVYDLIWIVNKKIRNLKK